MNNKEYNTITVFKYFLSFLEVWKEENYGTSAEINWQAVWGFVNYLLLKGLGFFFLLHRQHLQSQATSTRQCRDVRLNRGLFQPLGSFSRTKQFYIS